jgi:hypothetical protein
LVVGLGVVAFGVPLLGAMGGPLVGTILPHWWFGVPAYPGGVSTIQLLVEWAMLGQLCGAGLIVYSRSRLVAAGVVLAFVVSLLRGTVVLPFGVHLTEVMFVSSTDVLWLLLMVVPLYVWALRTRRAHLVRGRCRKCMYDLTGIREGVCPECGTPVSAQGEASLDATNATESRG